MKLSISQTFILDGVETGVLLSDFAEERRRKNADVTDTYFILLDAAAISPTLVLNQNATIKEKGSWVHLKIIASEAGKNVHSGVGSTWVCAILSEN